MLTRRLFYPFATLSLLLTACGGAPETQSTAATATAASSTTAPPTTRSSTAATSTATSSTTAPTSSTIKPAPTTAEEGNRSQEEIDALILDTALGLAQFNTDVAVLNEASGYDVGEEMSVELSLRSCSVLRSKGGAGIDLLRLQGLIASAITSEFLVSPFTLEMSDYAQAFLASAATNICNKEAEAVFESSQGQFADFTAGEYRFLVSLHAANNESIWAYRDADLVQLGNAICDEYPGFNATDLIELSSLAFADEDPALSLSILYAGGSGSLCPEYSDTIDEVVELLTDS